METAGDHRVRLSRSLCFLLRHAETKARTRSAGRAGWLRYVDGGWYRLDELLEAPFVRRFSREDLLAVVEWSMSARNAGVRRFEVRMDEDGTELIRATYGHSFDVHAPWTDRNGAAPEQAEDGADRVPTLSSLCVRFIVDNIKSIQDVGEIGDPYLLQEIFAALKASNRVNNSVLKGFLTAQSEIVDLSGLTVTLTTLEHIARRCTGLIELRVPGCLAMTDHALGMIARKCRELQVVDVSGCPNVTRQGMLALGNCPEDRATARGPDDRPYRLRKLEARGTADMGAELAGELQAAGVARSVQWTVS